MSNHARKIKLSSFTELRNAEASIEIDLENGQPPFVIRPPEFWAGDLATARLSGGSGDDLGTAVLGPDEWARWKAAGRDYHMLNAMYEHAQGMTSGE